MPISAFARLARTGERRVARICATPLSLAALAVRRLASDRSQINPFRAIVPVDFGVVISRGTVAAGQGSRNSPICRLNGRGCEKDSMRSLAIFISERQVYSVLLNSGLLADGEPGSVNGWDLQPFRAVVPVNFGVVIDQDAGDVPDSRLDLTCRDEDPGR